MNIFHLLWHILIYNYRNWITWLTIYMYSEFLFLSNERILKIPGKILNINGYIKEIPQLIVVFIKRNN